MSGRAALPKTSTVTPLFGEGHRAPMPSPADLTGGFGAAS